MGNKEVQLKPGQYTSIVKEYEKPIIVIGEQFINGGYFSQEYATSAEAMHACKHDVMFANGFVCVYNLAKQEYVEIDIMPLPSQKQAIANIIAYYLNKIVVKTETAVKTALILYGGQLTIPKVIILCARLPVTVNKLVRCTVGCLRDIIFIRSIHTHIKFPHRHADSGNAEKNTVAYFLAVCF